MCLRVEKVLVACFVGRSSVMRNFVFRITEGSKLEPACSISVDAPFFNTQVRYHGLAVVDAHGAQTYRRWHRDVLPNGSPLPKLAGATIERIDADQPTRTLRACQHGRVL